MSESREFCTCKPNGNKKGIHHEVRPGAKGVGLRTDLLLNLCEL